MKCVTREEFEKNAHFLYQPHLARQEWKRLPYLLQFDLPQEIHRQRAFLRAIIEGTVPRSSFIVDITDVPFWIDDELTTCIALRSLGGETRPLLTAPCHLFEEDERLLGTALFLHTVSCGWSSAIFARDGLSVVGNWEGGLLDLFVSERDLKEELGAIARTYGIEMRVDVRSDIRA